MSSGVKPRRIAHSTPGRSWPPPRRQSTNIKLLRSLVTKEAVEMSKLQRTPKGCNVCGPVVPFGGRTPARCVVYSGTVRSSGAPR